MMGLGALSWALSWALLLVSALLVGFAKTGISGTGILAVPLMAMAFPAKQSVGVLLPMLIVADILAVITYHRHARWALLWPLFPWVIVGIVIATAVAEHLSDNHLQPLIGIIVIAMLLISWRKGRNRDVAPSARNPLAVAGLGVLCGITTMLANAAGPIMTAYLLVMRLPKVEFIGTGAWYFLLLNVFKIPFMIYLGTISLPSLKLNAIMVPVVLLGGAIGIWTVKRIDESRFRFVVTLLAWAAAITLLASALPQLPL